MPRSPISPAPWSSHPGPSGGAVAGTLISSPCPSSTIVAPRVARSSSSWYVLKPGSHAPSARGASSSASCRSPLVPPPPASPPTSADWVHPPAAAVAAADVTPTATDAKARAPSPALGLESAPIRRGWESSSGRRWPSFSPAAPESVLLIRRAERAGDPWSGHMALPGGRRERAGRGPGGHRDSRDGRGGGAPSSAPAQLAGGFDDVVPRTPVLPPIAVRPFVFLLSRSPSAGPQSRSRRRRLGAAGASAAPETYRAVRIEIRGESREMPAYHLEGVWCGA